MLTQLYIRNYALIREVRLDLSSGFTVLTGETGAGKSILLGALGLVLGERADTSVLQNPSEKCIVEGVFVEPRLTDHPLAIECDLQGETEWCIRREVSAAGKSRAFLNDTPVNLNQLQSFASALVDLHQQFDTLELTEADRQREILDGMAGHLPEVEAYHACYLQWRADRQALTELESRQTRLQQEREYDQHIWAELEAASFQPGEIERLEEQVRVGGQSEGLTQALLQVAERLQGEGENVQLQLRRIQQSLQPYEKNEAAVQQWQERLRAIDLEVREMAREIDRFANRSSYDPQQLALWQDRLSEGFRLLKKHGLKQTQELIELQQQLGEKLRAVQSMHEQVDALQSRIRAQEQDLQERAHSLRATRRRTIGPWTEQVNQLLQQVGMPTARFGVQLEETDLRAHGADECLFVLDANYHSGQSTPQWQPVRKVASGGELSRLMLCIKSLAADRMRMPTLVFDEIDAGISGEAAKQVGLLLRALGNNRQVICVTHQPQVAAKGKQHWHVTKAETSAGIETHVACLSAEQRVEILARIIGGESPTATARRNAEELLAS